MDEQTEGWRTEEFGPAHEGRARALLADGSEPKPVLFDASSGGNVYRSSEWWLYDGEHGRPQATHLRGACSCGWHGAQRHPVDWTGVEDARYGIPTLGPYEDWAAHIDEVRARSVPLPAGLEELLEQVGSQLTVLVADAPLAALKAVAVVERTAKRIGREAAYNLHADEVSMETIGTALGLTERDAWSRLYRYSRRD
jgi:hypothetical protein